MTSGFPVRVDDNETEDGQKVTRPACSARALAVVLTVLVVLIHVAVTDTDTGDFGQAFTMGLFFFLLRSFPDGRNPRCMQSRE